VESPLGWLEFYLAFSPKPSRTRSDWPVRCCSAFWRWALSRSRPSPGTRCSGWRKAGKRV